MHLIKKKDLESKKQTTAKTCGLSNSVSALIENKDIKEFVPMKLTTKLLLPVVPALALTVSLNFYHK